MLKTEHIKIRVTKEERSLVEKYAEAKDTTISKTLRKLINQLKEGVGNETK